MFGWMFERTLRCTPDGARNVGAAVETNILSLPMSENGIEGAVRSARFGPAVPVFCAIWLSLGFAALFAL